MNILIRKTYSNTLLALIQHPNGQLRIGEGMNLGEAVGNLLIEAAPYFVDGIQSIKWDTSHGFTKHYVSTSLVKEIIYERQA